MDIEIGIIYLGWEWIYKQEWALSSDDESRIVTFFQNFRSFKVHGVPQNMTVESRLEDCLWFLKQFAAFIRQPLLLHALFLIQLF